MLAALSAGGFWWRASWIVNRLLRSWAATTMAQKSENVYRLSVGRIRFNILLRRVAVDSIHVTTNRGINAARLPPLANLRLAFHQCTISGVHLITLVRSGGLIAGSFGCRAVSAAVVVPRGVPDTLAAPRPARRAFLVLQQGLQLPSFAPRVRIARIDFPHVGLDFRLQREAGEDARLTLEQLRWRMADLAIDPADMMAAARPLFGRTVQLAAANFVAHPRNATVVRVGALRASLSDSTVELRGVGYAPALSDAQFARSRPYRRDLIKTTVGRMAAEGIDVGAFVLGRGLRTRRLELDSLRLDITSDRRRPSNPTRQRHRTPQAWIADLDRTLSVDSVLVRNGEVVYREQRPGRARPGVFTFARLEAVAANLSLLVGRRTSRDTMTLTVTTHIQNAGRLDVRFVTPLDAPQFITSFRGTLGAMPATALNPFVQETFPLRIANGRVVGISFRATVANGVARGTITPRYHDLSVAVTRAGSGGILGSGGVLGGAARGIASFVGNLTEVRANNPDDPEKAPRSGTIRHTFTSDETLPAFLWGSVRDGLLAVVRK